MDELEDHVRDALTILGWCLLNPENEYGGVAGACADLDLDNTGRAATFARFACAESGWFDHDCNMTATQDRQIAYCRAVAFVNEYLDELAKVLGEG